MTDSVVNDETDGGGLIRNAAIPTTDLNFLSGGGEVGALMRRHDWKSSPLGDPGGWPQSLRSVVGLLLNSKFPMFVAWGEELGFLYNDSYAEILGAKHPSALGARFHDIWSEIWPDILPLIEAAMRGEAIYRENLPLVMDRKGFDEHTWFTFSYSPVRDESGVVAGMFCAVTETTAQVLGERHRDALLRLDDRLRDVADTANLSFVASELLGESLGVVRVGYGVLDPSERTITVERNWSAPGFADVSGLHRFDEYGTYIDDLLLGKVVTIADVTKDPRTRNQTASFSALGIRAHLDAPVVENGRGVAEMFVHSAVPRAWTDEETVFIREVAERTHAAIRRRAAEHEQQESEARFRAVFNSDLIGLAIFDAVTLATETVNDCFLHMTGHTRLAFDQGRWDWRDITIPEYLPLDEAAIAQARDRGWWDAYEKYYRAVDGKVFPVRISSAPMPGYPGKVIVSVEDISDRKRWELHQRLLVGELNHRVKNSLAIVQSLAHQTFPKNPSVQPFLAAYEQRLGALAAAHNLLTRTNWASADLHTLITDASSLHSPSSERIQLTGEPVSLSPQAAVSLAMAVHELATNALKYGSLSNETGRVDVSWRIVGERLVILWQERGGPKVQVPSHRGFGSRMIQRALSSSLAAETKLDFEPTGVRCKITAPLSILA